MIERTAHVNGVDLHVLEDGPADGPPVLLVHGFPEGAYSWRHQLPALAAAGYHAIAPDQRGYGYSSRPDAVTDYGIDQLCGDLLGLLDETGHEQGVVVGHDWGALIAWDMVRLHPDRVRAVVGVSVPFVKWPAPPTQVMRHIYGDRFFYILYFQEVGPAEREMEADTRRTMAKFLWAASGDAAEARLAGDSANAKGVLDTMPDPPAALPAWLTDADIDHYAAQFAHSGFFGPVSYYRNLDANYARVGDIGPEGVTMPSFFIGGDRDVVIAMDPAGVDRMRAALPNYRGDVILPGIGHWTQQEAPDAFNEALLGFLGEL